jgi:hypothetical protein
MAHLYNRFASNQMNRFGILPPQHRVDFAASDFHCKEILPTTSIWEALNLTEDEYNKQYCNLVKDEVEQEETKDEVEQEEKEDNEDIKEYVEEEVKEEVKEEVDKEVNEAVQEEVKEDDISSNVVDISGNNDIPETQDEIRVIKRNFVKKKSLSLRDAKFVPTYFKKY